MAGIVSVGVVGAFQQMSPTQPAGAVGKGTSLAGISLAGIVRAGSSTDGTLTPGQQTCRALAAAGQARPSEIAAIVSVSVLVRRAYLAATVAAVPVARPRRGECGRRHISAS